MRTMLIAFVTSLAAAPSALAAAESKGAKDAAVGFDYLLYGFNDTTTNVAFAAFAVFMLIALTFGGGKAIFGALDKRAADIRRQLDEAKALREEANKMMAEAETRAKEAEAAAEEIIKRAKADAKALMEKSKAELEAKVARREAQAEQRISRAEAEAAGDVRKAAADAATEAARAILSGTDKGDELFAKALDEISGRLN